MADEVSNIAYYYQTILVEWLDVYHFDLELAVSIKEKMHTKCSLALSRSLSVSLAHSQNSSKYKLYS